LPRTHLHTCIQKVRDARGRIDRLLLVQQTVAITESKYTAAIDDGLELA
jgi:hypothetical protein